MIRTHLRKNRKHIHNTVPLLKYIQLYHTHHLWHLMECISSSLLFSHLPYKYVLWGGVPAVSVRPTFGLIMHVQNIWHAYWTWTVAIWTVDWTCPLGISEEYRHELWGHAAQRHEDQIITYKYSQNRYIFNY